MQNASSGVCKAKCFRKGHFAKTLGAIFSKLLSFTKSNGLENICWLLVEGRFEMTV